MVNTRSSRQSGTPNGRARGSRQRQNPENHLEQEIPPIRAENERNVVEEIEPPMDQIIHDVQEPNDPAPIAQPQPPPAQPNNRQLLPAAQAMPRPNNFPMNPYQHAMPMMPMGPWYQTAPPNPYWGLPYNMQMPTPGPIPPPSAASCYYPETNQTRSVNGSEISGATGSPLTKQYTSLKLAVQLLQSFDGTNIKVKEFLDDCRHQYNNISPADKPTFVRFMKNKITGEAREHLKLSQDELSFERISECLERAYKPKATLEQLMSELNTLRQKGKEETVLKFYNRTKDLLDQIIDAATNECSGTEAVVMVERAKKRATHCYVRGLNRHIGDIVNNSSPNTLEKALEAALEREQYLREQYALNPPRTQPDSRIKVPETVRVLTVTDSTATKRRHCYTCDSTDHIRRACPHQPAKWYCTHCRIEGHSWSHCVKVHGKDKIKSLKEEEKRARIERENKTSTTKQVGEQQKTNITAGTLNDQGVPQTGGARSAPIVIPPPTIVSTSTQK